MIVSDRSDGSCDKEALTAAVEMLRSQPMAGRGSRREMYACDADNLLVGDDEGTVITVESFDDAIACYYFIKWLDNRRRHVSRQRASAKRRALMKVVLGARC